jgi:hypothetical protein
MGKLIELKSQIEKFAESHRLHARKNECGEQVILGRMWKNQPKSRTYGHHIFDNGDNRLGIVLMFDSPAKWTFAQKKLEAAGFTIRQHGISSGGFPKFDRFGEGVALFESGNRAQSKLAITLTGARAKRVMTPDQVKCLSERLKAARQAKAA